MGVGGGDVGEQIIVIAISHEEYMFLLHFLSIPWCGEGVWGGGVADLFIFVICTCVGGRGGGWMWVTKTAF